MKSNKSLLLLLFGLNGSNAFTINGVHTPSAAGIRSSNAPSSKSTLSMAMDDAMRNRLDGITRSYQALTERLGDPDVIADSKLLMKVMSDRSKSESVVLAYEEVR